MTILKLTVPVKWCQRFIVEADTDSGLIRHLARTCITVCDGSMAADMPKSVSHWRSSELGMSWSSPEGSQIHLIAFEAKH